MLGDKRGSVKHFAKREKRKDKIEKTVISFFLILTVASTSILFLFLFMQISFTGYATYMESAAGTVSSVSIEYNGFSPYWFGLFGLAVKDPAKTEQPFSIYSPGEVVRQDVTFPCIQDGAVGGNELYISASPTIDFDSLVPASTSAIDAAVGCDSGNGDCPSDTFTSTMSILVGDTNISNIPSTETFRISSDPDYLDIGALYDGTNFVYVTKLTEVITSGNLSEYKNFEGINYQAIIPIPKGTSTGFYFFTDENDVCPNEDGTVSVLASVYGYVKDERNFPVQDAIVTLVGQSVQTDANGFYTISLVVPISTLNLFATKEGYQNAIRSVTFTTNGQTVQKDLTLKEAADNENVIDVTVSGSVKDIDGAIVSQPEIYLGNNKITANTLGNYEITASVQAGNNSLVAIKENYNNYYTSINFSGDGQSITKNIVMQPIMENTYATGPYTEPPQDIEEVIEELIATGEDYWISTTEINREIRKGTFLEETIGVYNLRDTGMNIKFQVSPNLKDIIKLDKTTMTIDPEKFSNAKVTIYATADTGTYEGKITVSGDLEQEIPVTIKIVEKQFAIEVLLLDLEIFKETVMPGDSIKYKLNLQNLLRNQDYKIFVTAKVKDLIGNETYSEKEYVTDIQTSTSLYEESLVPENLTVGDYLLEIQAQYLNEVSVISAPFIVSKPIYMYSFFGIPVWLMFVITSSIAFVGLNFFAYKRYADRKKRYKIAVDNSTLPQPGKRVVKLGNIAETKKPAYYEIDRLTTHAITAGATGMGKSISAQVMIEECLMKGIAVIIFDPTAQWSGMLRKCTDKKMLSFYAKFGLKPKDARAFKGNVRMIQDCNQVIDINKYAAPGEIQIFSMNKLSPQEIDVFVENVIKQVFRSDPKEAAELKTLLVFDEVHRLLPKFGGSGKGFLQIERCCREFRKWGLGVILISQVLNDFVGEIKANINTEMQARTLDEGDLERIKSKYGEEYLKALVRAEIGVIMFQNAEYNRGRPYFVNFRPILHSTRRLTDEELQKYNKYNEQVDDIEFQIEALEKEGVDSFDLKMELKLIKDKIMSGSFSVVEIYLEGLVPRVKKEWDKLGKSPPKRTLQLVDKKAMEEEDKKTQEENKKAEPKKKEVTTPVKPEEKTETKKTTPAPTKPETKPTDTKPSTRSAGSQDPAALPGKKVEAKTPATKTPPTKPQPQPNEKK